ncbi:MAG: polysaccharide deacetylase family protein [Myxococcales bacterium]|nr:polysaccharide deacetylase family protein [Polyangiaceae bacterium]MDW8248800.1 polysaccharide deacetylase family protein [Myxococcales bacterium]
MLRSLLIKVPTLLLAGIALWWFPGVGGLALAAWILGSGVTLLLALVLHPNASFWVTTRSRARGPSRAIALSFDDGPDPMFTPLLLDLLAEHRVKAAFFLVGERVEKYPDLVVRIHQEGHLVANHSHCHQPSFPFLLTGAAGQEIDACNEAISRVIGVRPRLFRAPLGFKNPALGDALRQRGMVAVGWQARGYDAFEQRAETIARRILAQVRPGGVVLLHDGAGLGGTLDRRPTLEALPQIIHEVRARGLDLIRLDTLLGEEPYQSSAP